MPDATTEMALPELLTGLVSIIGKKLTAYIAGAKDTISIDRWIAGVQVGGEAEQRLRFAYQIVMTLHMNDEAEVVQAWLMGLNPDLGDRTALRMLREDSLDVVRPLLLAAVASFAVGA